MNENPNTPGGTKNISALLYATASGNLDLSSLLISAGADPNCTDGFHTTPLHYACRLGHNDLAGRLISEGGQIDATDQNGMTSLMLASHYGHLKTVQLLLSLGADPLKKNIFEQRATDILVDAIHRRTRNIFDGSETLEDYIQFQYSEEALKHFCSSNNQNNVHFEDIKHLVDSVYLKNLSQILRELSLALATVGN